MSTQTDRDLRILNRAINKAINNIETPVKEKHVRSTIIGTFTEKGAHTFWLLALRLPLQDDRIVAWKFCHVLHKLLRAGYPTTIQHSQRHVPELENLGQYWVHLKDCYGELIKLYCTLLMAKLDFHKRNPAFPGNLVIADGELENIGENDNNTYFQMAVEMFDYMDTILDLQIAIFRNINRSGSNSMTSSGQCRLSPLIPCVLDASQLYDFCVKILFRLHSELPPDILLGHRERFLKQFRELQQFYRNTKVLQYFKNLITIPSLPENPPNFLVQSELRTYVTPKVIIPPEEPEPESAMEGSLIDTSESIHSDTPDNLSQNGTISPMQNFTEILAERDYLIEQLQQENTHLRYERKQNQKMICDLREQITTVDTELATRESELEQERQLKEDLFQQAATTAQNQDSEQKLREEKISKLKALYSKLRESHIQLIRQKADVDKKLLAANKSVTELQTSKNELDAQLKGILRDKSKEQMELQESSEKQNEALRSLQEKVDILTSLNQTLKTQVETLTQNKTSLEEQLNSMNQRNEQLDAELKTVLIDKDKEQAELQKSAEKQIEELQNVQAQYDTLTAEHQTLKTEIEALVQDKTTLEQQLNSMSEHNTQLQKKVDVLESSINESTEAYSKLKLEKHNEINSVMLSAIQEAISIMKKALEEIDNPAFSATTCTPEYFCTLTQPSLDILIKCQTVSQEVPADMSSTAVRLAHVLSVYIIHGHATSHTTPDIMLGEQMADKCKNLGGKIVRILQSMQNNTSVTEDVEQSIIEVKAMNGLTETLQGLLKKNEADLVADLLENELSSMDKAIEEAVNSIQKMLSKSRAADSGVKLQVNEKILDSCTKLMNAIRILVQKSKFLQAEIVAQGKGSASLKEFYKRNHRWTEGLISAAKAVGYAAGFLLESADKVVSDQAKLEQMIVAANEISSSTVQLVVASRVKADKNSENLAQLSQASRSVTSATAEVLATVKDCAQMIDEKDEFDATKLTLHAAKRLEMETQISVLELEKDLEKKRNELAKLRKQHYQLAGENEGWEVVE